MEVSGGLPVDLIAHDSICRNVSNRAEQLRCFSASFDIVVFVSGKKSSNGMVLYDECRKINPYTYLVYDSTDINKEWFTVQQRVGICGATSTPVWLMEEVAREIEKICT